MFVGKVVDWVFRPIRPSVLTRNPRWDVLLITGGGSSRAGGGEEEEEEDLPHQLRSMIGAEWKITVDLSSGETTFKKLLDIAPQEITPLDGAWEKALSTTTTTTTSEHHPLELTLTQEMQDWMRAFAEREGCEGPVSIFNLLAYNPGLREAWPEYLQEFVRGSGSRRGGSGRLAGDIVGYSSLTSTPQPNKEEVRAEGEREGERECDSMVIAQYPSVSHFAEMLVSDDYRAIDRKYRVEGLKDTRLLCVVEVGADSR